MSDPLPPINPDAQDAIDQVGKDEQQLHDYKAAMAADMQALKEFLSSLDAIVKKDGAGVAFMMMMSKGFADIDAVKNDNFLIFSAKLNLTTDYQTLGSMAEGYVNEGATAELGPDKKTVVGGISREDDYSLYRILQKLKEAKDNPDLDAQTGAYISSSADSIFTTLQFKDPMTNAQIYTSVYWINSRWSDYSNQEHMSEDVKTVDNAFDQISNATSSSSQMLQTEASVASNSYKSYLGVETKNFSNWSTLVSDINRHTSQAQ